VSSNTFIKQMLYTAIYYYPQMRCGNAFGRVCLSVSILFGFQLLKDLM